MSGPVYRRTILSATILLATMAPRAARAQNPIALPGDLLLLKTREWQLRHDRARLQDDIDRGDAAAVNSDLHRVRRDERRIEFDRWMLRSDLFLPLAFTTHPQRIPPVPPDPTLIAHPQYPGYGYFPSDPSHLYRLPQPASVAGAGTSAAASAVPARRRSRSPSRSSTRDGRGRMSITSSTVSLTRSRAAGARSSPSARRRPSPTTAAAASVSSGTRSRPACTSSDRATRAGRSSGSIRRREPTSRSRPTRASSRSGRAPPSSPR
jgi:hypothetical protein